MQQVGGEFVYLPFVQLSYFSTSLSLILTPMLLNLGNSLWIKVIHYMLISWGMQSCAPINRTFLLVGCH